MGRTLLLMFTLVAGASSSAIARSQDLVRAVASVDFGPDRGQNYGTLFEVADAQGRVLVGAGFLGAYNTQPRSERMLLQVFVRAPGNSIDWKVERLPRVPGQATGYYPFSVDGVLYVHDRGGGRGAGDPAVHRWDEGEGVWLAERAITPYSERVAGKILAVTGRMVSYDGKPLLEPVSGGSFGEHYFAGGNLFVKEVHSSATPPINRLIVCPWKPEVAGEIERREEWTLELPIAHEFIYTFAQLGDEVLAISNNGRVSRFDGERWDSLRDPVPNVSYQIYAGMNVDEQLLLGHYPTGEIFSYDGAELVRREGWPPVLPGVSRSAREAQTLSIYGGEVFAGVWPWGEVWRQDADRREWAFANRFFRQPLPDGETVHPYETETKRIDAVGNLWGQRITGMQPHGSGLVVTTSSKSGSPWESRFAFLSDRQREEYGAVYRAVIPGNLAVPVQWRDGSTSLEVLVTSDRVEVRQDGTVLGEIPIPETLTIPFRPAKVVWGAGSFGKFGGKIESSSASVGVSAPNRPWRAVYLNLNRLLAGEADAALVEQVLADMLERAKRSGVNTLLPYANDSRGRTVYPSSVASECAFGKVDVLGMVVRGCRARGIAVYPVVCMCVSGGESPAGILSAHPEWGLRHMDGSPLGYISPAHGEARAWMASLVREVATRYRPDGVILDYIRFHNRPLRLDPTSEEAFEASLEAGMTEAEKSGRLQAWKEAAVTDLVHAVSRELRASSPDVLLGAYCWGAHTRKGHLTAQVWDQWVSDGSIDLVNVSGYVYHSQFGDSFLDTFVERMRAAHEVNQNLPRHAMLTCAVGIQTSHGSVRDADDVVGYLDRARDAGLSGVAFFRWESLVPHLEALDSRGAIESSFGK